MADVLLLEIFDVQFIAAGFLGGLFHAYGNKERPAPSEVVRSVIVGGIAGNFATQTVIILASLSTGFISTRVVEIVSLLPPGVLAFWVGMSGRKISSVSEALIGSLLGKTKNE